MSSPGIFDPAITAQPCRAGCRRHVHLDSLPSSFDDRRNDLGGGTPPGWTTQPRPWNAPDDELMWFMCNSCEELVREDEVEGHRCEQ